MCTSTKRHFITCIVIVSREVSILALISKGGVEVKINQNEPMVRKAENVGEYFFEYFHVESVE